MSMTKIQKELLGALIGLARSNFYYFCQAKYGNQDGA